MSIVSMMTLDLGQDAHKVADTFNDLYELGIRSGAADVANSELVKARQKARAAVDLVIAQVEGLVQSVALEGVSAIYDSLGINEQSLKTAKNIVAVARHATNIGASILMRGIVLLNGFQSTQISLPMDAYGAALGLAASVADMMYGKIAEKYGVYIDLLILMCVNPSAALELIGEFLLINANQIYNLLDEQCYLYTGLHVVEIYNLCAKGIEMYNEYKRKKREKKKDTEENNPDKPKATNIKSTGIGVSIEMEPEVILENMYNWLWEQNDALFNGFIVL